MPQLGAKIERADVVFQSSAVTAAIVLTEPFVVLRGFKRSEQAEALPAILRGSLVLQVHKPTKIKTVTLEFKGTCRTEWPEGIPPLKADTHETKTVFYHGWPFFNAGAEIENALGSPMICTEPEHRRGRSRTLEVKEIFQAVRSNSPQIIVRGRSRSGSVSEKSPRVFAPAEYVYNFELALPSILPETARGNFGFVRYHLEASLERHGTFKPKLSGVRDITILRSLAINSLEFSEPIVIDRCWEDLLHYEIVVAGKVFPLGGKIPIAISLRPLDKAGCHRVRVYITEHSEYYCKNRKVHRVEPSRRFLLLDHRPEDGIQASFLNFGSTSGGATELNLAAEIKKQFPGRRDMLKPNISSSCIKVHHWIKISLRLSRPHPTNPGARKTYEISIDSPITLVDSRVTNTASLPAYDVTPTLENRAAENSSIAFQAHSILTEPVADPTAFLSQPSIAPPSIEAEQAPPSVFPPEYSSTESIQSYQSRYRRFEENSQEHIQGNHVSNIYWHDSEDEDSPNGPTVTHESDYEDDDHNEHRSSHEGQSDLRTGTNQIGQMRPLGAHIGALDLGSDPASPTPYDDTDQQSDSTGVTSVTDESNPSSSLDLAGSPVEVTSESTHSGPVQAIDEANRVSDGFEGLFEEPSSSTDTNEDPRPFTVDDYRLRRADSNKSALPVRPMTADSRRSSTSSVRRFYRQTSVVSVDLVDDRSARYRTRGGGAPETGNVPWNSGSVYGNDNESVVTVYECGIGGADRAPLLGEEDHSELDLADYDDDVMSLISRCPSIIHPR